MTDDDKALVERLRDESIVGMPMENEAADLIEAQAAEIEELKSWKAAEEAHHHKLRTEIDRLEREVQRQRSLRDQYRAAWEAEEARAALGETK